MKRERTAVLYINNPLLNIIIDIMSCYFTIQWWCVNDFVEYHFSDNILIICVVNINFDENILLHSCYTLTHISFLKRISSFKPCINYRSHYEDAKFIYWMIFDKDSYNVLNLYNLLNLDNERFREKNDEFWCYIRSLNWKVIM